MKQHIACRVAIFEKMDVLDYGSVESQYKRSCSLMHLPSGGSDGGEENSNDGESVLWDGEADMAGQVVYFDSDLLVAVIVGNPMRNAYTELISSRKTRIGTRWS